MEGRFRFNLSVPRSTEATQVPQILELLRRHVSAILQAGIIEHAWRGAYVSFPFLFPNDEVMNGKTRIIVDYSHLTNKLKEPASVYLPLFLAPPFYSC